MKPRAAFAALIAAPLLAALSACASLPDDGSFAPIPRAAAPYFDPLVFFAGTSTGRGVLDKVVTGKVPVRVESTGRLLRPGLLELVQVVTEGDKEPRTRRW
ncbi:MAG: hypothetical protein V2J14_11835 [Erythrobacter sp.]|jgi:hypothetical protein|nr:hypothetical protein [Erythrobacter sp.]